MNTQRGSRTFWFLILACGLLSGFATGWWSSRRFTVPADVETRQRYVREKGDAAGPLRTEVLESLREFQEGYSRRNPRHLDPFMGRLFPRDQDVRMIGTDTNEWHTGHDAIGRFVRDDWLKWGDVHLAVDEAVVSSFGDVAWLATTGTVTSRAFTRSIRFTAVLTRRDGRWLFRQVQFQYDERPLRLWELLRRRAWSHLHIP